MIPVLTIFANVIGHRARAGVSVKLVLPVTDADFTYGARVFWRPFDAYYSVIKAFFFAGCHHHHLLLHGIQHPAGRRGRGQVHHRAVVASSVMILLLDTVLAKLLLNQ